MIRVILPSHLRMHADINGEVTPAGRRRGDPAVPARCARSAYPVLRGTVRDYATQRRRPFLRFFACQRDLSLEAPDTPLPEAVVSGAQPFLIVAAIAGG